MYKLVQQHQFHFANSYGVQELLKSRLYKSNWFQDLKNFQRNYLQTQRLSILKNCFHEFRIFFSDYKIFIFTSVEENDGGVSGLFRMHIRLIKNAKADSMKIIKFII